MKLRNENVQRLLMEILRDQPYWAAEGKEAEKTLAYISGAIDMANAVIEGIAELEGGKNEAD